MDRDIRLFFNLNLAARSVDLFLYEQRDGNVFYAKIESLSWFQRIGGEASEPLISLRDANFSIFLRALRDMLAQHGYAGSSEQEIKRVENHLEDMRRIVFQPRGKNA